MPEKPSAKSRGAASAKAGDTKKNQESWRLQYRKAGEAALKALCRSAAGGHDPRLCKLAARHGLRALALAKAHNASPNSYAAIYPLLLEALYSLKQIELLARHLDEWAAFCPQNPLVGFFRVRACALSKDWAGVRQAAKDFCRCQALAVVIRPGAPSLLFGRVNLKGEVLGLWLLAEAHLGCHQAALEIFRWMYNEPGAERLVRAGTARLLREGLLDQARRLLRRVMRERPAWSWPGLVLSRLPAETGNTSLENGIVPPPPAQAAAMSNLLSAHGR